MPESNTPAKGNKTDRFASVYDLNDRLAESVSMSCEIVDGLATRVLYWTGPADLSRAPFVRFGPLTYRVFDVSDHLASGFSTVTAVNIDV